ncbi:heme oxygenase-like protein [Xylaria castorea]|nr:heme oxygenase-like protein [Xylaria castorea]
MPSKSRDTTRSLSNSINAATRPAHTKLNKLVISRLRLALPPLADDASQYVSGLLHVTPVYMGFESLWRAILESSGVHNPDEEGPSDSSDAHRQSVISARTHSLLASLRFEGLQRSQALRKDLISLTGWSSRTLTEQLNHASESPVLGNFLNHTRNSVEKSPHVLLAYAWVLYMALFSGGRFIRASLENIYPAFWIPASAQQPTSTTFPSAAGAGALPLDFFRFDTPVDGEDLKLEFKQRLLDAEGLITESEREDIIQEAGCIFDYMIRLVGELDDVCGTDKEAAEARLLSLRSRDSVVVENERRQHFAEARRRLAPDVEMKPIVNENRDGRVKFG